MIALAEPNWLSRSICHQYNHWVAEERPHVPRDFFRGSETHTCGRRLGYGRRGEVPSNPFSPHAQERMKKGDLLHHHIRNVLVPKCTGGLVECQEQEVALHATDSDGTSIHIIGHIDGLLETSLGWLLVEIKSTSSWGYKSTLKANWDPNHYSYSYLKQANRYGRAVNLDPTLPNVNGILLVLYNVNGDDDSEVGFPMRDWTFNLDDKILQEDLKFLFNVERDLQNGKLPQRGFDDCGWECVGCQWYETCWPLGERIFTDSKLAAKARELAKSAGDSTDRTVPGRPQVLPSGTHAVLQDQPSGADPVVGIGTPGQTGSEAPVATSATKCRGTKQTACRTKRGNQARTATVGGTRIRPADEPDSSRGRRSARGKAKSSGLAAKTPGAKQPLRRGTQDR